MIGYFTTKCNFFLTPLFARSQHIAKALNLTILRYKQSSGLMMLREFDKNRNAMRFALCAMRQS
jgi:hypothetical protein